MSEPLELLQAHTRDLVQSFLAQLPFLAVGLTTFLLALLLGRVLRRLARRALERYDPGFAEMVARLVHVAVLVLGGFLALWIAIPSVQFAQLFTSLGVTGLILGFALRDIIENFVAGILILWRRPFRVGDQIRSGIFEGTVIEITFRATVLRTSDGIRVFLPNGRVFTEPLENLTANEARRSLVVLGIDQDSSVAEARQIILRTVAGIEGVLTQPTPTVLFAEVGDFANILHVLYWTVPPTRVAELTTRSEVTEQLYEALSAAGIRFPYPIQTLHVDAAAAGGRRDGDASARGTRRAAPQNGARS
jgi:small-conductance mechanosensitive channel